MSPLDCSINFIKNQKYINEVVIGCNSLKNFNQIKKSFRNKKNIYPKIIISKKEKKLIDPRNWRWQTAMKIKTLISDSNFKIIFEYKNIAVYGKFIDIFIDNKVYEIKSLPILLQKYNVETIITNSVGSFFLIEKNKQNTIIYNSFGNSSLFFK